MRSEKHRVVRRLLTKDCVWEGDELRTSCWLPLSETQEKLLCIEPYGQSLQAMNLGKYRLRSIYCYLQQGKEYFISRNMLLEFWPDRFRKNLTIPFLNILYFRTLYVYMIKYQFFTVTHSTRNNNLSILSEHTTTLIKINHHLSCKILNKLKSSIKSSPRRNWKRWYNFLHKQENLH